MLSTEILSGSRDMRIEQGKNCLRQNTNGESAQIVISNRLRAPSSD